MKKLKAVIRGVNALSKRFYLRSDEIFDYVAFVDRNTRITATHFYDVPIYTDLSIMGKLEFDLLFIGAEDVLGVAKEYNENFAVPYERMISLKHTHQRHKQISFCAYANELSRRGVSGSVAEVGVDFGDTAKYINLYFPDRTLYLFDTFSGFDQRDIKEERDKGTLVEKVTSVYDIRSTGQEVLERMFFPDRCILKTGYFPESLDGLEDIFAFVHIDCDLQKPIKEALEYFYPRLARGGIISVHDYFNPNFPGVRVVVREFSEKMDAPFQPHPLSESAVFVK